MKSRTFKLFSILIVLGLIQMACSAVSIPLSTQIQTQQTQVAVTQLPNGSLPQSTATVIPAPAITSNEPFKITGSFKWTSEIQGTLVDNILFSERQVVLTDLHGFIIRDKQWELPVYSQVLGYVNYDPSSGSGTYELSLPEVPQGTFNNVSNKAPQATGIQIFAIDYEPNLYGGPFESGDDRFRGWPTGEASIKTDSNKNDEIIGGKIIIWSPDDKQQFPTGFGTDGKLFTADDPVSAVPAGYTVVNLDATPFTFSQAPQQDVPLYEAPDVQPHDYSNESYTKAFDDLVDFLKTDYAFNGIQGKQPNWDQVVASIRPRIQQAEQNHDAMAFYTALRDFTYAFKDGHTGLDGGKLGQQDFQANYLGSLGFTVRVLDDGNVMVDTILPSGPAGVAGMKVGAIITKFNGNSVMDTINSEPLFFGLQSSPIGILSSKAIMLTRTKPGAQVTVSFTNTGGQPQTVTLTAVAEVDSLLKELGANPTPQLLPVQLQTLTVNGTNIGYIQVNTNEDDINLILRLFERGLKDFQDNKVAGIIIDLRNNGGGTPLGLAGFLTDQTITMGQLEYYNSITKKFEPQDQPDQIIPNQDKYHFDKIAVLVGLNCASACELEAYGFSKVPGAIVVGQYPTAGIEAEVSRGQVKMPEGINMQFPTGREVLPDGSLFLEGQGVQPTLKVPVNENNVLSSSDVILQAAENVIVGP